MGHNVSVSCFPELNIKINAGISACLPWRSPFADSFDSDRRCKTDDQEKIDMCLSCEREECCNCIENGKRRTDSKKYYIEQIGILTQEGYTYKEIPYMLGISKSLYFKYRKFAI